MGIVTGRVVGITAQAEGAEDEKFYCMKCRKPGERLTDDNVMTVEWLTEQNESAICDRCGAMFPEET